MEAGSLSEEALLFNGLELRDLKAYGTFFVGWRLKFTDTNGTYAELFYFRFACIGTRWESLRSPGGTRGKLMGWSFVGLHPDVSAIR